MTGKAKATRLTSFFEGRRRKAELVAWSHLRTKAGESRVKLDLRIPLLNESVLGMDEAISEAFTVMCKDKSSIERTSLNVDFEGMTIEAFTTDKIKSVDVSSTGCRLCKLALVAAGEGESRQLDLLAVAYIPASIQVRDWAWVHLHQSFWLETVYSQTEMNFSAEEDEGEDEEEEEPVAAAVEASPIPISKKNGPKQLAELHAALQ